MTKRNFTFFLIFLPFLFFGQEYFRLSADFTAKQKNADGNIGLTKGKVYYDKHTRILRYDIYFPRKMQWIITPDKMISRIEGQEPVIKEMSGLNEFSVFHLALNASLDNFGLENSPFKLMKVDKKDDLVISYWKLPPSTRKQPVGYIAVAKKKGRLESVVMMDKQKNIISKQFFKDYLERGGFVFPQRLVHIRYDDNGTPSYEVIEFKNIVLNDVEHNEKYEAGIR